MLVAYLCNLLFVINHQQRYRQKDDSEALNGVLKSSSCGQLVALLQAGDEIRETQAHSRQPLLCSTVLRRKLKIKKSFSTLWNKLETIKRRNKYIKWTAVPSSSFVGAHAGRAGMAAPGKKCVLWTESAWKATYRGQSSQLQPGRGAAMVETSNGN